MKKTILYLLVLVLTLGMVCTTAFATEAEGTQEETTNVCEVKLTHISLAPSADALGYKAELVADEAVMSQVTGFGFELWLDGCKTVTYTKTENITNQLTLRLRDVLSSDGGEMNINGRAFVTIGDQTIYSDTYTTTMKSVVETINGQIGKYSKTQIQAIQKLLNHNAEAVAQWNVADILNWQEKVSFVGGTYVVVAMAGEKCYALGSSATSGVAEAIDVTGENGEIVIDDAPEWNINVLDQYGTVTLTNAEGDYLWRSEEKLANLYISATQQDQWKLAVNENGYYTLANTDTDTRYLSYNGTGFKAYAEASDSRFIEFMLIPTMPTVEIATGEYAVVAVAGDAYYAMGATAEGGVVEAVQVTVEDGVVTNFDTNKWSVNVLDDYGTVTLTNAEGDYLWRAEENAANLYISATQQDQWKLAVNENGYYTLTNTDTDTRYLSYSVENNGFKAYWEAAEDRFIEILLLPVKEKPVLTSGTYMVVGITKDGEKAMGTTVTSGVAAARDVVYVNGEVYAMDPWTVTIGEDGLATFTNAAGKYLVSNFQDADLATGDIETKWTVGVSEDGYFTFRNTHTDKRYLSYNGTGFKVYSNSSVQDKGYDVKFMMVEHKGLQSGRYALVAKAGDKYYAMGDSYVSSGVSSVEVALNNFTAPALWSVIVNADGTVSFRNAAGQYINGTSGSSNLKINDSATNWTVAVDAAGYYTFHMGRYLMTNATTNFKAYDGTDADKGRYNQFMLIPADEISSGKYQILAQTADGQYYAMQNTVSGGAAQALAVTVEDGKVVTEGVDFWNVNMVYGNSVAVITTEGGEKLMRSTNANSLANLVLGNTSHKWVVAYDAVGGYYTLINTNDSDSRFLSYSVGNNGFKAYAGETEVRIIKLLLIPVE